MDQHRPTPENHPRHQHLHPSPRLPSSRKSALSRSSSSPRQLPPPTPPTQLPGVPGSRSMKPTWDESPSASSQKPNPLSPKQRTIPGLRLVKTWQFWTILSMGLVMGLGSFAAALLFKIPALPNCPSIFWPTASAALRLYCAELAANKKTVNDLLEAIALVNSLPTDHPLRPEIDRNIELWSAQILELADASFHNGDFDTAIQTAQKIPVSTPAHAAVQERVDRWQSIWAEAERIYQEAESAILNEDLQGAFSTAGRLLSVGNRYWETTRYEELIALINATREEGQILGQARRLARQGGLSQLLEAIKLAKKIEADSPLYQAAQRAVAEFGNDLLKLGLAALDRYDADLALSVARQIPPELNLRNESRDLTELALAQQQASYGSVADLESAIIQAQRLGRDRPLYDNAQQLIRRWQLEIQAVSRLQLAERLAEPGSIDDLRAAIAEAQLIPSSNPRIEQAQDSINQWTRQIQTLEDRPYLDRAEQLAQGGDVFALESAILEARRIGEGRALYDDAQRLIADWTAQSQRIQDRPYLLDARRLATTGNLSEAIATAEQIQPGRVLYDEAQGDINRWQAQIVGTAQLQRAYELATIPTPVSLSSAIRTANQVPDNSPARFEAEQMINIWSQDILDVARSVAQDDIVQAIAIAEMVPSGTEAYTAAQAQIEIWREQSSL